MQVQAIQTAFKRPKGGEQEIQAFASRVKEDKKALRGMVQKGASVASVSLSSAIHGGGVVDLVQITD